MKRLIVALALMLCVIALTAADCGSNIAWTSGTPLSPCKDGVSFDPGYLGAYQVRWSVTVHGTPSDKTDTSGDWDADTTTTPYVGEHLLYGGYQYKVLRVNAASHTMSVQFIQSC